MHLVKFVVLARGVFPELLSLNLTFRYFVGRKPKIRRLAYKTLHCAKNVVQVQVQGFS